MRRKSRTDVEQVEDTNVGDVRADETLRSLVGDSSDKQAAVRSSIGDDATGAVDDRERSQRFRV